jgi:ribosomal protein S18 acetylase RimI-like enzyme
MTESSSRRHGRVRLRRATAADATRAAEVWRVAWWDGHRGHVPPELARHRADDYFRRQSAAWIPLTTLAVDADDTIVGVAIVERDELVQLAVDGGVRRLGVGAALLQAAEDEIGAEHELAWLAVVPSNARARRFYENHGWRDAGFYVYVAPGGPDGITIQTRRYVKGVGSPTNLPAAASGTSA